MEISLLDDRDRRPEAPRTRIARFCMPTLDEGDRPGQPPIQLVRLQALAQKVELDWARSIACSARGSGLVAGTACASATSSAIALCPSAMTSGVCGGVVGSLTADRTICTNAAGSWRRAGDLRSGGIGRLGWFELVRFRDLRCRFHGNSKVGRATQDAKSLIGPVRGGVGDVLRVDGERHVLRGWLRGIFTRIQFHSDRSRVPSHS